ncbi:MAG: radical SAM protein [Phycisphaerales bacterium]|nr:radical SAM protein [Phycisphaerales bacterium]
MAIMLPLQAALGRPPHEATVAARICCYHNEPYRKIAWQITNRCHLRCPYCFTPERDSRDLTYEACVRLLNSLRTLFPHKDRLLFAGREPLLHDSILNVLSHANTLGYRCSLSTSGELLNANTVEELCNRGLQKVNVTVNAADSSAHAASRPGGRLARVLDGIRFVRATGMILKVNVTLVDKAATDLTDTLRLLAELDVRRVSVSFLHPAGPKRGMGPAFTHEALHAIQAAASRAQLPLAHIHVIAPPEHGPCSNHDMCPASRGLVAVLPDGTITQCNIFPFAFPSHGVPHE